MFSNSKMSEFDPRGGQHFSNKCEIQESLNYLLGGAVKPNSDIVLKCFLFFLIMAPPLSWVVPSLSSIPSEQFQPLAALFYCSFSSLQLARACGVPVGRRSGCRLATTLVATKNDIIFSFLFFPVVYFSHRRRAPIKKLI